VQLRKVRTENKTEKKEQPKQPQNRIKCVQVATVQVIKTAREETTAKTPPKDNYRTKFCGQRQDRKTSLHRI
jgi:hypothetical protein